MLAQFGILRGHAHRTSICVALAHHHAAQHNQRQRAKRELVGAEHGHDDDVLCRLQLSVGLQAHLIAQAVSDQRLLRLCQANLGRDACKAHARSRTCTSAALGTTNNDEVGLCLRHTSSNSSNTAFGNQLHADGSRRIDVLQVEDKLRKILDAVNVVMRRWRNKTNARNGITCLGNDVVHLETWQLSAFARLGALCHLNLYFLGIHQVFSGHAKASRGNLLGLARQRDAIDFRMVAGIVLAALARVRACAELVHG